MHALSLLSLRPSNGSVSVAIASRLEGPWPFPRIFTREVWLGDEIEAKLGTVKYNDALRPQRPEGLSGTGIPGQPPQFSHSS